MRRASDFGFFPGNTGEANSAALQKAVLGGGEVFVDGKGIADVREPVVLEDNTTLRFENGLTLRRNPCPGEQNGYAFVNKGAFDGVWNEHITIEGLRLICNEVFCRNSAKKTEFCVPGLRGMIAFLHIRHLVIRDLEVMDLPPFDFCVHVCTFEDVVIENVHVEGRKDAIHFGRGKRFVVLHGIFRTFDDPIALNAHDYATSNPELGWIEDGVIEDCYDLDDKDTAGYFCRMV